MDVIGGTAASAVVVVVVVVFIVLTENLRSIQFESIRMNLLEKRTNRQPIN